VAQADIAFLVNPAAANGTTGRRWPEIARQAADAGLRGEALLSEGPGHIVELSRRAVEDGARLVVVVGGDGTVNEAVNGLLHGGTENVEGVELALLPRGTGDDFARTFGIPTDLERALEVAASGSVRSIDAGRARFLDWDTSHAERYFANFAGAGISGAIARRGEATSRRLGARLAYLWATVAVFARWKSVQMTVELDNDRRQGRMYEVLVANGAYAAGGMRVAPEAAPDDELFDIVMIGDVTKAEFLTTFPKIYRGTHVGHPKVEVVRARTASIDAAVPLPVVLDGEQPGTTPATFEVLPGALRLRVPR
jgi:diacylglycerol kinase (ATP)